VSSKRVCAAVAAVVLLPLQALGSDSGPIQDNSFLIEEAYNQEAGVIQHISTFTRSLQSRAWAYTFTEEWPVGGLTHQASATFTYAGLDAGATGLGDVALNYRWQALGDGEAAVALAPRLTLLVPTGDARRGLGAGGLGVQTNIPLSAVLAQQFVTHVNLGGTYVPSALASAGGSGPLAGFSVGQSFVWLARSRLNFLVEALYTLSEIAAPAGLERTQTLTVSPGVRGAIDFANGLQVVGGVGVPIGLGPSHGERGVLLYLSFEHPLPGAGAAR
jgi:hypothetical protein